MAPSDGGTIISSSNPPTVIYLRLTDFSLFLQLYSMWFINLLFSCLSGIAIINEKNAHRGNRQDTKRKKNAISFNQIRCILLTKFKQKNATHNPF